MSMQWTFASHAWPLLVLVSFSSSALFFAPSSRCIRLLHLFAAAVDEKVDLLRQGEVLVQLTHILSLWWCVFFSFYSFLTPPATGTALSKHEMSPRWNKLSELQKHSVHSKRFFVGTSFCERKIASPTSCLVDSLVLLLAHWRILLSSNDCASARDH